LEAVNYLVALVESGLSGMEEWSAYVSRKTDIYRMEFIEYLHETLSINGTISHFEESCLSDNFKEFMASGKDGNLCNRGTLLNKDQMKNSNSFLSYNFTNRVFIGKTKPDNIYACIPCGVELVLRKNGFNMSKARDDLLYFHIIPDYFFTPESWELVHSILLKFNKDARIKWPPRRKNLQFDLCWQVLRSRGRLRSPR
jgi:CRISPR-associated protein Csc3